MQTMKPRDISELERALGYQFSKPELLEQALTHSSQARELESLQAQTRVGDNEQLEFLGDAVLGLVTTEELFHRFPNFREGELSKLRAHLVSEKHLILVARQLELGHYLRLGRGEEKSGGRNKTALLVDGLEAVLGAMYVDSGLETVRRVVLQHIVTPEVENLARFPRLRAAVSNESRLDTEKALVFVSRFAPGKLIGGFPIRALLVSRITGRQDTVLRRATAAEGFRALAPTTLSHLPGAEREAFRKLSALVREVPVYTLEAGTDLPQIPRRILEFLSHPEAV